MKKKRTSFYKKTWKKYYKLNKNKNLRNNQNYIISGKLREKFIGLYNNWLNKYLYLNIITFILFIIWIYLLLLIL